MSEEAGAETDRPRFIDRLWVRRLIGRTAAVYMRLVRMTSRIVSDPPDLWQAAHSDWPAIAIGWHGDAFVSFVVIPEPKEVAILVSLHADGEMMAAMAVAGNYHLVRGQGANSRERKGTGGAAAFRGMIKTLRAGITMFATADIPPERGRQVSVGMVALARKSRRPIYAISSAASRRRTLKTWDMMQIPLPFSRIAFTAEGPFYFDDDTVSDEAYAALLAEKLARATSRAFALADGGAS